MLGRFGLLGLLACAPCVWAQTAAPAVPPAPPALRVSRYLAQTPLSFQALVPQPPAPGSAKAADDLAAVRLLQSTRSPLEIEAAQRDDHEESIFAFRDVMGPGFTASDLPLTALLSQHLRQESGVVNPALKLAFHRARPFVADPSIKPVCERTASNSYPSGHAMVGYLEAFALAQMFPEKADAIYKRAGDYARNRIVCGVHYPTDVEASRTLASALFGALSTSTSFQEELASARKEARTLLEK